mmetsp:Transcript_70646/g.159793  ORF Transcript_70646/g.159793 Transcript_70646/m.159793 type:complete len:207 (+) Transcript_70646:1313-1933(+)
MCATMEFGSSVPSPCLPVAPSGSPEAFCSSGAFFFQSRPNQPPSSCSLRSALARGFTPGVSPGVSPGTSLPPAPPPPGLAVPGLAVPGSAPGALFDLLCLSLDRMSWSRWWSGRKKALSASGVSPAASPESPRFTSGRKRTSTPMWHLDFSARPLRAFGRAASSSTAAAAAADLSSLRSASQVARRGQRSANTLLQDSPGGGRGGA